METQFVSYDIAKKLKELGYVEECMGVFECSLIEQIDENTSGAHGWKKNELHFEKRFFINNHMDIDFSNENWIQVGAPLWQEVFDWFREKFNWYLDIYMKHNNYVWEIFDIEQNYRITFMNVSDVRTKRTYEKARKEIILKAIELIKDK